MACEFSQKEGIDYEETFAPIARYTSIRSIPAMAAVMKWKIHWMDVKTAFLNGVVEEEVYVEQPLGFETHERESHVCRLKKSMYGLKQAPRTWYGKIDNFLSSLGFTKSKADSNLYYKAEKGIPVILLLYVDDLFVIGMDGLIADTKMKLATEFKMKDLGMMHYFLEMEVWQNADGIFLGQGKYAIEIFKRFGMMDYKAMTTPMASNLKLLSDASSKAVDATTYHQMIGSLMYLTNTRPDFFFSKNTLIHFLRDMIHVHLITAKHTLSYLKGIVDYGLKYEVNQKINLEGYVDLDWAYSSIDRKSTSGCYFSMRSGVIYWFSRK